MSGAHDVSTLRRDFAGHADTMASRAPRWSQVSRYVATAPEAEPLLTLLLQAPPDQRRPVLALAALHDVVLAHPHEPLGVLLRRPAAHEVAPEVLWSAVVDLVARRSDEIADRVRHRHTQTNEVGRCAVLLPLLADLADETGPLSLVELGSSAGLLLNLDRYRYRYQMGDDTVTIGGDLAATPTVEVTCSVRAATHLPQTVPPIASRLGVDPHAVDVDDAEATRWLEACVWPDQHDRLALLRRALAVARQRPVPVVRHDGVDHCPLALADAPAHPVLLTSWALTYVPAPRRHLLWERLEALGRRRDLTMVLFEDPALIPEIPVIRRADDAHLTVVAVFRWRSGRRSHERLGTAHPHGAWWLPGG